MVSADVGFQCVDCVKGARADQVPKQATPFPVATSSPIRTAYVTWVLIAINVVVFMYELAKGVDVLADSYGLSPYSVASGEWWRLFSAPFLHGNFLHILFNMFVLFSIGPPMERILGHTRFVVLYLVAALGGSVASYFFSPVTAISIGASGAIFGLMGAMLIAGLILKFDIRQIIFWVGLNLVFGFVVNGAVDWRAHLGGLITGAAVTAAMLIPARKGNVVLEVVGVLVIVVALVGMTFLRTEIVKHDLDTTVGIPGVAAQGSSGTIDMNDRSLHTAYSKSYEGASHEPA